MLCTCIFHLVSSRKTGSVIKWISTVIDGFKPDFLEIVDDHLRYENVVYTDDDLVSLFSSGKSTAVDNLALWSICRFIDDDINKALRELVKKETGVSLECVPFTLDRVGLTAVCDYTYCSGDRRDSDWINTHVDNNRFLTILPLESDKLRQFFTRRLKMVVQYAATV